MLQQYVGRSNIGLLVDSDEPIPDEDIFEQPARADRGWSFSGTFANLNQSGWRKATFSSWGILLCPALVGMVQRPGLLGKPS